MKKLFLIVIAFHVLFQVVHAQAKLEVITTSGLKFSGYFENADQVSITLTKGYSKSAQTGQRGYHIVAIMDVKTIKTKGKSLAALGAVIGGATGFVVGSQIVGNGNNNRDLDAGPEIYALSSTSFGLLGGGLGALLGTGSRKTIKVYQINGDVELLNKYKSEFQ